MLAELESHVFPPGRGSRTREGQAYTGPLEQGKGFDLKIAPFEMADEKEELIKQQASLQVNHFSLSHGRLRPSASEMGARLQQEPCVTPRVPRCNAPDGLVAARARTCRLWEGEMPAGAEESRISCGRESSTAPGERW